MVEKIWHIYKITNLINNKVYIGQASDVSKRWSDHRRAYKLNKPTQIIHHAFIKYGLDNFQFEIISCCKNQEDANDTETTLVSQYDSYISKNGYNATNGGANAPKTEEWRQKMRERHASRTEEEKLAWKNKLSEATHKQIEERGHPAQGTKRNEEQIERLVVALKNRNIEYTPELRKKMSDAHKGKPLSADHKEKLLKAVRAAQNKRVEERYAKEDIRCQAPNCEVIGKAKYKIINGIRCCVKHGQRLKKTGSFELLPKKPVLVTDKTRKKISESRTGKGLGRVPHNKQILTEEQINFIINDPRSIMLLSEEMKIGRKVISRIRKDYK